MEAVTLARPYARAAFELAQAQGTLDAWSANLALAAAVAADPRVAGLGNDPRVAPAELARLHRPDGMDAEAPFTRLLDVMADNRRLGLLPQVAEQFAELRRAAEARVKVRMLVAAEPAPGQLERLAEALHARLGRNIETEVEVAPEILGGAVIDVDGEVIDGSVRAQLEQLQAALTR